MNKDKDYVEYYGFKPYTGYEIEAILGKQLYRFVTILSWAAAKTNNHQALSQVIDQVVTFWAMQDVRAKIKKEFVEANPNPSSILDDLLNGSTSLEKEVAKA